MRLRTAPAGQGREAARRRVAAQALVAVGGRVCQREDESHRGGHLRRPTSFEAQAVRTAPTPPPHRRTADAPLEEKRSAHSTGLPLPPRVRGADADDDEDDIAARWLSHSAPCPGPRPRLSTHTRCLRALPLRRRLLRDPTAPAPPASRWRTATRTRRRPSATPGEGSCSQTIRCVGGEEGRAAAAAPVTRTGSPALHA